MSDAINQKSYALCLVAYLYRCYKNQDPVLNYPTSDLPLDISYAKPTTAKEYFLTAQCIVNRYLRPYLEPVFQRIYRENCGNEENFSSYLYTITCHNLIGDSDVERSSPMKLLARFAFATELVLYCFRKGCYRLSNYLPDYLHAVLRNDFIDVFTSLTKEDLSLVGASERCDVFLVSDAVMREARSIPLHGYIRLENYCQELIGDENHPTMDKFREIGDAFLRDLPPVVMQPRGEPGARELGARNCDVCGGNDCINYLTEFIVKCDKEYGNCDTCLPTGCCTCPWF